MPYAGGGKGRPRLHAWGCAPGTPIQLLAFHVQVPYAGGRAPCTPGPERCPWEPQFDATTDCMTGAHAYGQC